MIRRTRETYQWINAHPQPTDAMSSLAHVVDVYDGTEDDRVMVTATHNVYDDGVTTGLTMGDLREILNLLSERFES